MAHTVVNGVGVGSDPLAPGGNFISKRGGRCHANRLSHHAVQHGELGSAPETGQRIVRPRSLRQPVDDQLVKLVVALDEIIAGDEVLTRDICPHFRTWLVSTHSPCPKFSLSLVPSLKVLPF